MQEHIVRDACCRLNRCAGASSSDNGSRLAILSRDAQAELLSDSEVSAVRIYGGIHVINYSSSSLSSPFVNFIHNYTLSQCLSPLHHFLEPKIDGFEVNHLHEYCKALCWFMPRKTTLTAFKSLFKRSWSTRTSSVGTTSTAMILCDFVFLIGRRALP